MKTTIAVYLFLLMVLLVSCTPSSYTTEQIPELRILTHDAFAVSESVVAQFESAHHAKLVFIKTGDAGSLLNRAILTSSNPEGDVLYGIDNTYLSRALKANLFQTYTSLYLSDIPTEFILDENHMVTPIDYGDVCINYDRQFFASHDLEVPSKLSALSDSRYKGLLVVQNPALSSPGLAFLLTSVSVFGEDGYLDFWQSLKDNKIAIVNDWSTAYYTNFSGSAGKGPQPLVVSYDTSPAAEVFFAETPPEQPPTGAITAKNTCFRQIEFAGILKGAKDKALASAFIDYMLGLTFQQDIPLQMFMFPVNENATIPQVFLDTVDIPKYPVRLAPDYIADNRDQWIQAWNSLMLR